MSPQEMNIRLEEAKETLEDSLQYLINDAKEYDKGNFKAIKRAAGTLRTLLLDPEKPRPKSKTESLLHVLNVKDDVTMKSFVKPKTADAIDYNYIFFARFKDRRTRNKYYDTFLFYPEGAPRNLDFNTWWNEDLIIFKGNVYGEDKPINSSISRKDLIKIEANKDGIDHFDKDISGETSKNYFWFKRGRTGFHIMGPVNPIIHAQLLGGDYDPNETDISGHDINLALTRQIVHETLISLLPYFNLQLNYKPDFDTNWHAKLNRQGWKFNVYNNNTKE